ncbi:centromere protein J [Clonorchis sinensis]|uniref:Centromere protein J n=1 Tax=Clonorchis sinensis TaxID=79923 RepID=G7YFN2_CLOSI|nr:centromere protein J [Clonorchis sinensis]
MARCLDRPAIFNPSESWVWKSGVKVDYAPEDTLKSVIFSAADSRQDIRVGSFADDTCVNGHLLLIRNVQNKNVFGFLSEPPYRHSAGVRPPPPPIVYGANHLLTDWKRNGTRHQEEESCSTSVESASKVYCKEIGPYHGSIAASLNMDMLGEITHYLRTHIAKGSLSLALHSLIIRNLDTLIVTAPLLPSWHGASSQCCLQKAPKEVTWILEKHREPRTNQYVARYRFPNVLEESGDSTSAEVDHCGGFSSVIEALLFDRITVENHFCAVYLPTFVKMCTSRSIIHSLLEPQSPGRQENPEGSMKAEESSKNETCKNEREKNSAVTTHKRPIPPRVVITKPAPFLKRRQGMAAWCSKIRRQGLPVRDPAGELRKKQHTVQSPTIQNNSVGFVKPNQHVIRDIGIRALTSSGTLPSELIQLPKYAKFSITSNGHSETARPEAWIWIVKVQDTCRKMRHSLPHAHSQNMVDGFSPPTQISPLQDPTGGLLCGLMPWKKSISNSKNEIAEQQLNSHSPARSASNIEKLPAPNSSVSQNGLHNEASDLEEFELLEEIAENSSFSSLTTSFISKLGKNSLRDRLQRAEERIEKMSLVDGLMACNGNRNADIQYDPPVLRSASTKALVVSHDLMGDASKGLFVPPWIAMLNRASYVSRNSLHRSALQPTPERNILSNVNKQRSDSGMGILRSASAERPTDGILAKGGPKKDKKVTRFHLVREATSTSREDVSLNGSAREVQVGETPAEQQLKRDNTRGSMEFDDMNSWICDATNEVQHHQHSPMNVGSPQLANGATVDAERFPHEANNKSPSSGGRLGETYTATIPFVKRQSATHRSLGANSHSGSKSPSPQRPVVPSYETEIIALADEFVEKLKRDPQSAVGRTYVESQAAIRQWITRLESEVRRFKTENTNLLRLKAEREESMKRLECETKKFEEMREKERKLFSDYRENEMRKLKKERRVLDEYQRALKSTPAKKEREEIERLRDELQEARSDLSRREVRWHAAIARLRSRIEELEAERDELKTRVRRLEDDRIELQAQLNTSRSANGSLTRTQIRRTASSVGNAPLGGYRWTSRSGSHSAGLDTLVGVGAKHRSSTIGSGVDRPLSARDSVSSSGRPSSLITRRATSTDGTRESVHSGGYYTGEDDCLSLTSGGNADTERHDNKGGIDLDRISPATVPVQSQIDRSASGPSKRNAADEKLPVPGTAASGAVVRSVKHPDGSSEETYVNGATVISYANGSVKEVFPDRKTVLVSLFNGDIKRTLPDGRVLSYTGCISSSVWQFMVNDRYNEISRGFFSHFYDSHVTVLVRISEIIHPKSTQKSQGESAVNLSGTELTSRRLPNGDREISLPNGQREIHSVTGIKSILTHLHFPLRQCRIYPDGTTKTVFPDGRHETRYSSGRLRVKDAQGVLEGATISTFRFALYAFDPPFPGSFYRCNKHADEITTGRVCRAVTTTFNSTLFYVMFPD